MKKNKSIWGLGYTSQTLWLRWLSTFQMSQKEGLPVPGGTQNSQGSSPGIAATISCKENLRRHLKGNPNKLVGM